MMEVVGIPTSTMMIIKTDRYLIFQLPQSIKVLKELDKKDKLKEADICWDGSKKGYDVSNFIGFLQIAADIAITLDCTITSKADFERVRLIPYPDKVKKQGSILIAELGGEIVVMYPGKWVE